MKTRSIHYFIILIKFALIQIRSKGFTYQCVCKALVALLIYDQELQDKSEHVKLSYRLCFINNWLAFV